MLDRRTFIGTAAVAAAMPGLATPAAAAQGEDAGLAESFGFIRPEDDPVFGPAIRGGPPSAASVGAGPSRHEEVRTAFRLLYDAPRGSDHMAVVRYFAAITARNQQGQRYNQEWSDRANPLIVGFFSMTNTTPSTGDRTHWCAAFVSFCLYAANKPNKFSALSGAYRTYGTATTTPVPGDIVVFSKTGPDGAKGFGHVGFFLSRNGGLIKVLGGNQRGDTGSTGAVTESDYPVSDSGLQLHSFRRVI